VEPLHCCVSLRNIRPVVREHVTQPGGHACEIVPPPESHVERPSNFGAAASGVKPTNAKECAIKKLPCIESAENVPVSIGQVWSLRRR
jgi:hypothetical protein